MNTETNQKITTLNEGFDLINYSEKNKGILEELFQLSQKDKSVSLIVMSVFVNFCMHQKFNETESVEFRENIMKKYTDVAKNHIEYYYNSESEKFRKYKNQFFSDNALVVQYMMRVNTFLSYLQ